MQTRTDVKKKQLAHQDEVTHPQRHDDDTATKDVADVVSPSQVRSQ